MEGRFSKISYYLIDNGLTLRLSGFMRGVNDKMARAGSSTPPFRKERGQRLFADLALPFRENNVGRFFANHVNRADDEEPWNAREYRRIHDAQTLRTVHAEVTAEDAVQLSGPDGAAARGVMPPGMRADVVSQLIVGLNLLTRQLFFGNDAALSQPFGQPPGEIDSVNNRVEVFTTVGRALLKVSEIDLRRIARIGGSQLHLASAVVGMRLQNRPGEIVEILGK